MKKSRVRSDKLTIGMITATDVISITGTTIVPKGTALDDYSIGKISRAGVTAVIIETEDDGEIIKRQFTSLAEVKKAQNLKNSRKTLKSAKQRSKKL